MFFCGKDIETRWLGDKVLTLVKLVQSQLHYLYAIAQYSRVFIHRPAVGIVRKRNIS